MAGKLRKSPPVSLGISLVRLLLGKLRLSNQYNGDTIETENGEAFTIFRHIYYNTRAESEIPTVFIVRFKFARLSHRANKLASVIPMLLIAGFPGFNKKIYAVNKESGYWQGIYQWQSKQTLEEYKKSFVFKMMNRRAMRNSVTQFEYINQHLTVDFIKQLNINDPA